MLLRHGLGLLGLWLQNTIDWGGLKGRNLFLNILEAGESKIKVLSNVVPGESSPPDLQIAEFCLGSHMIFPLCLLMERLSFLSLLIKTTNPIMRALPSGLNLTLITSQSPFSKHYHILGLGL